MVLHHRRPKASRPSAMASASALDGMSRNLCIRPAVPRQSTAAFRVALEHAGRRTPPPCPPPEYVGGTHMRGSRCRAAISGPRRSSGHARNRAWGMPRSLHDLPEAVPVLSQVDGVGWCPGSAPRLNSSRAMLSGVCRRTARSRLRVFFSRCSARLRRSGAQIRACRSIVVGTPSPGCI